ncbi:prepilin-type N-terminal cleavage/methylation domain-containing protein [Luteibacter jiangsuensis]|uniref:Prepilin-type N-terminal cleavage/methylation domain-containing protein n=1 Tax=Luteibacter jiangsuensis TaxID=637577 RepID=A0ABX0Q4B6_9GAMM|nr:pilin [Luteibacter jiangsuensis]NID05208.1 prepilin-type N-terminal cleavage/methylation domain-containing protein [Luteibacter jiangsuensis]
MHFKNNRTVSGFTLIELMIVVAIIAILAAIAVPQYKDYLIRSQASEGFVTAAGAKAAVWEYVHNTGRFPTSNQSAGLPDGASINGKYVSSVALQDTGVILIAYLRPDSNEALKHQTITLSPIDTVGAIGWTCKSTLNDRYLPTSCRSN